ncbi:serine/threonine-protein phosphatase [Ectothiorhodospiraceae bacterium 2226]|nr:serine/threonine-protein phosphatase [Ectothiorhodospiraceae bacterium 2226]
MRYELGQASRLGNRAANQDRFAYIERDDGVLLVLADGMGGQVGGELAAQLLVDVARRDFLTGQDLLQAPEDFLTGIIEDAHRRIVAWGESQQPPVRPGSTAVLCLLREGHACWAHAGDSRLYLFRKGLPLYRTDDHSYVEKLYRDGLISRERRHSHPMRNYVTQCIGCAEQPVIEFHAPVRVEPGDVLLLCSDGLWGGVDDARMGAMLAEGPLELALDRMAEQAEQHAYPRCDNISALALRWQGAAPSRRTDRHGKPTPDPRELDGAIEEIENAIRRYAREMKKD